MESCGIFPEGRRRGWKPVSHPHPPFLGLAAREHSSVAEDVDLLQVQEKAKARMKVPCPISPQALGVTLRNMQSLHMRKETCGDGRALLHPNKIRCTNHRPPYPQGGLYALLPRHQSGLSRALRLPPACVPSPLPRSPSVWFPARGELEGSRAKASGPRYCQAPGRALS